MRESGFYWVKVENYEWEVAKYNSESKEWLFSDCEYFKNEELEEIDEKRIIR